MTPGGPGGRRATACLAGCALLAACAGAPPPAAPAPEPRRPQSYAVLLADDDGTTGAITVSGPRGTRLLDRAGQSARLDGSDEAPPETDPAQVRRTFAPAMAALPAAPEVFRLYFRTGAAALDPPSQRLIDTILAEARRRPGADVSIVGHTDTQGDAASNERLGRERAESIARLLRARGLEAVAITVVSHGESDLLVPTPDGTNEIRNRRVEVIVR